MLDNINANGNLLGQRPEPPLAWSLCYQFPVHTMGPDNLPEETPAQPTYLMVYRNRQDEVHFLEITPVSPGLIALLQENETYTRLDAIYCAIKEMNHPYRQVVVQSGENALMELRRYGIILETKSVY
jgi:hypothetical protein